MRKLNLFFLILILTGFMYPFALSDFGESSTSLGQFTDEFTDLNNVSVQVEVVRNATLNAMELNISGGGEGYGNFTNYIEFDVDYNRVNSNLTNFPILLVISTSSGIDNQDITAIFDEIGDSYLKIAVTNTSMLSEHYIEVERWDSIAEIGILWISPDVSSLENTTLRLHFDSGVANNTVYVGLSGSAVAANVWDANFATVYHMGSGTGNEVDSTGNGNLATEVGTVNQEAGQIGYSRDLLGTNDFFHYNDADLGIGAGEFTVETWFFSDGGNNGRLFYTYNPTSGLYVAIYRTTNGNFDIQGVVFIAGGAEVLTSVGTPYSANTWYYIVFTRDSSNDLEMLLDSIQVDTGTKAGNVDAGGHGHIGIDRGHNFELNGRIDEMRISTSFRSNDWTNSSRYSGVDDLIYWESSVVSSGAGYSLDGYFTTTNYLDYANGSILVLMTNSTIPANTGITVEFSEDNATWTLNDWDPLFGGFESIDLRELNWSSSSHLRYNLTTTDSEFTPRLYQSRLITTEGEVGPGIPGLNVTGEWVEYRASAINFTVGTHAGGDLNSTFDIDGDTWNHTEVVGAPGSVISINFTGVDPDAECIWVTIWYLYNGNLQHDFDIEMWNFTSSAWVDDGHIVDGVAFAWANSTIYAMRIPLDFLSGGDVRVQLNHESPGNMNHDLFIDYVRLVAKVPGDVGVGAVTVTVVESDFPWIAIAIILMMVAYLLFRPK